MSKNEYGRIRRVGSERHPNGEWDNNPTMTMSGES